LIRTIGKPSEKQCHFPEERNPRFHCSEALRTRTEESTAHTYVIFLNSTLESKTMHNGKDLGDKDLIPVKGRICSSSSPSRNRTSVNPPPPLSSGYLPCGQSNWGGGKCKAGCSAHPAPRSALEEIRRLAYMMLSCCDALHTCLSCINLKLIQRHFTSRRH